MPGTAIHHAAAKGISYPKDFGMKTALTQVASLESIVPSNNGPHEVFLFGFGEARLEDEVEEPSRIVEGQKPAVME
ncbi:MAG: hypothetical protein WA120_02990 [Candidatus Hydromicrobium sp.]